MEQPKSYPRTLTPVVEALKMLNMGLESGEPDITLLTRGEHLHRIAMHLACLRWLKVTGHPVRFSSLAPALQYFHEGLALRAEKSTDPDVVADCINEAVRATVEGRYAGAKPEPDDIAREAIYQFLSCMAEVERT